MRMHGSPLGFYRRSAILTGGYLLLWLGSWVIALIERLEGGSSWLVQPGAGGVSPLGWMRFAGAPFALWLLADLWFIRREPAEFRKAQWAATCVMLVLLAVVSSTLAPLTIVPQFADSAP